jgi:pyruvate dehydrogenase E2 component (dihydrolipoamide acetyltransferase)
MAEFKMPSLGADMDAGTLVEWKIKPGDHVKRGDVIAAVETAKGVIEIEIFEDGIVDQIFVPVGVEVPVGQVIARICSAEELRIPVTPKTVEVVGVTSPISTPETSPSPPTNGGEKKTPFEAAPPAITAAGGERARISPLARKIAVELGVDITAVRGTGPGGAINRADIERAAHTQVKAAPVAEAQKASTSDVATPLSPVKPAPEPVEAAVGVAGSKPVVPEAEAKRGPADFQTSMRTAIAAAMAKSNREIPHYYLQTHIDMSRAMRWLEAENLKRSIKERLLTVVMMVKAVARSLTEVPELNGFWIDDHHQISEAIHIGFAISLRQGGLICPAIHDADMKTLDELREAISDLIMRTRAGRLRSSEMTDPTITLTNLGDRGVETVYGVIYPPQVALVGLGRVVEQPWAENGMLAVRPVLTATLAGDHRATDGHRGALFLEALNRNLQEVEKL